MTTHDYRNPDYVRSQIAKARREWGVSEEAEPLCGCGAFVFSHHPAYCAAKRARIRIQPELTETTDD